MKNDRTEIFSKNNFQKIKDHIERGMLVPLEFEAEGTSYVRNFRTKERLIILGAGHISQPLCTFTAAVGFGVIVVDDRPSFANTLRFPEAESVVCDDFKHAIKELKIQREDYVVVITRGHRYDADCLRSLLVGTEPKYLGMIGSLRRGKELLKLLEEEGFKRDKLDRIYTPIGIQINALTIQEIACSITAELIQCRRKNVSRRTKSTMLINEEIDMDLLCFLAEDKRPKAVLIVYETSGSTPVKSGAYMAVTKEMHMKGTIGGGCSENAVLHEARKIIGTGQSRTIEIDMSNDVAEDEGMVCGGHMKVLIVDVVE